MAKEEKANPYEGLGTGGKFRKSLFRSRTQTTPYDRPPTSLRNSKNGWLSKVVDPAKKLITYSAHSLFSSLSRKRLPSPQSHPSSSETEPEARHSHRGETSFVSNNSFGKQQGVVGESDVQINCSNGGGLTELEKLLRQKTFTRSEIDHLTALMRSRTVDASIREEEKQAEVAHLGPLLSCEQKEDYPKTSVLENGMENRLVLTPHVTSSAPIDDVASPAELAKAYMGSRPSKVSSSMFGVQSPALREDPTFLKCENLPLKSPVTSVVPRTARHAGVHENGFATTRTRGRSAIYNMARTPYARIYPTSSLKGGGLAVEREPASSTQSALDQDMLSGYKQGAVKRRSSTLDNDIGSVGPIRRIRHKPNLLYSKGSNLPLSGSSSIARNGVSVDASQQHSSSIQKSTLWDKDKHSHKLSEENVDYTRPSMSSPPLPSKSSEMASKILQQLDKLVSPKEKSSELRLPTMNDKSPMKLLHGQALQSTEAVDSSKLLNTIKDNKLDIDCGNLSASTQKLTSQVDKAENGPLKLPAPSDGLVPGVTDADSTKPRNQFIASATTVDSFMMKSVSYPPQKKRAFHMSAHEDCLDLDDDTYPNGTVSSVFPVEKEVTGPSAMAEKTTFGTEAIAEEKTPPLSVVMPSGSSTVGGEAPAGTGESADGSRVGEQFDVSTSVTSSIPDPTFKPATETSFGSNKPASPNGSIAHPPVFNFASKLVSSTEITATGAPSKEITNSRPIFGLEELVSSKEAGADSPLVNFGTNRIVDKVPQMLFTSSSSGGESTFLKFGASSDSKLGSSTSSTTAGATDAMPKVGEFGNADTKSNTDSVRSSELAVSSAASTSLFTSPTSIFGHSNGSLAASPSFSSPFTSLASNNFTSQNVFSSSSLAASSSVSATSTPAIMASSSSSSSNPLVASSSSSTSFFTFGSSPVPSKGLPISSSGSELLETKSRQDAGNGNLSSTAFGSSSAAVGSTGSGFFGFSSSAKTTVNSQSQSSVIGASNGSVLDTDASPTISGIATSTQTQSAPLGSAASSPSFGLTGNTAFSSGNLLFPSSSPATNTAFSSGSSLFTSSSSATNIFNSNTTFGFGTSATSSAANSASSNSGPNSAMFGTPNWQPSKSPFSSAFNFSSSSSGFSFGTSTASVASTSSPTMFSSTTSSSTPQFPFTSAASTSTQPAFGSSNSGFTFGSAPVNNDQMGMEDSMAEDTMQSTPPATPIFGQQPAPVQSNFVFGTSTPLGSNPFQFASQQNIPPQNPSPFQASGSLEFSAGGSFSLGTGGGDKSGRKIVKVKHRLRKK